MKTLSRLTMITFAVALLGACGGGSDKPERGFTPRAEGESGGREETVKEKPEEEKPREGKIMINEATAVDIVKYKIAGLGMATAEKIIEHRDANGPFKNMEDLDKVSGIGPSMIEKLKDRIDFGAAAAPAAAEAAAPAPADAKPTAASAAPASKPAPGGKINVNTASAEQLAELNGVGPSTAAKMIEYRQKNGPFKTFEDIDKVSGIGPATIEKFRDQIAF